MSAEPAPTGGIEQEVVGLVERAQDGDAEAFGALYDRYIDVVFGYVARRVDSRQTAEDLVGDVFLRAWDRLDTFSWQGVDPVAWLITIARNRVYDHYRASPTRYERPVDIAPDTVRVGDQESPERVATDRDMARNLGEAMTRLKASHREVVELRFVHNLSVAETAEAMGRSVGATKALQYRALRALAREVSNDPDLSEIAAMGLSGLIGMLGAL